jgi:hypothetical protein
MDWTSVTYPVWRCVAERKRGKGERYEQGFSLSQACNHSHVPRISVKSLTDNLPLTGDFVWGHRKQY